MVNLMEKENIIYLIILYSKEYLLMDKYKVNFYIYS